MRTRTTICVTWGFAAVLSFVHLARAETVATSQPKSVLSRNLSLRAQGDAPDIGDKEAIPHSYSPPTGFAGANWGSTPGEVAQLAGPLRLTMISATSDANVPELTWSRCREMEHFNVYSCLKSSTLRWDNRDSLRLHTLAIVEYETPQGEMFLPDTGARFNRVWTDFCALFRGVAAIERLDYHLSRLNERAQFCGVKLFFTASDTPAAPGADNSERILRALKRAFGEPTSSNPLPTTAPTRLERYFWCSSLRASPEAHATPCTADVVYALDKDAHAGVVLIVTPLAYAYIECQWELALNHGNPLYPTDWYLLLLLDSPPFDLASAEPIICPECEEVHRGKRRHLGPAPSMSGDVEAPPGITHERYDSMWDLPVWARHP
jgi:hypothetical protein